MMLVIECCAAEVNNPDGRVQDNSHGGRVDLYRLRRGIAEQNVFRLEIGMRKTVFVQEVDRAAHVVSDPANLVTGEGGEAVLALEIVDTLAVDVEEDAHVTKVIKPVQH